MASKIEELKLDLAELSRLAEVAERRKVKDILMIESRKLETEIARLHEALQPSAEPAKKTAVTPQNRCYDVKLSNFAWDQSEKFVKIFVTLKNVQTLPEENVHCEFTNRSFELVARGLENRNYTLPVKNLLNEISVEESRWKVKTDMVVVFLSKSEKNKNWPHLTLVEKKSKEAKAPSAPKTGDSEDPTAGLMDLMKQMYEDGDDDMKRTIAQSWTESTQKRKSDGW